jgi:hypothetical protein
MDQIQIAEYLAKKMFNEELKNYMAYGNYYVMLKNKQIYPASDYDRLVESNKLSPEDAFMYITPIIYSEESHERLVTYLFPLIDAYGFYGIRDSYLAKLGFYDPSFKIYPATGLKYYAVVLLFSDRLVIEITDIDTVATNTGLRKIVADVLGKGILTQKELSGEQLREISFIFNNQELFAGHTSNEVYYIMHDYYIRHDTSLAKEVLAIANAYNRIFEPYRVVYDTKTRQQVLI